MRKAPQTLQFSATMLRSSLVFILAISAMGQTRQPTSDASCSAFTAQIAFVAKKKAPRMQLQPDALAAEVDGRPAKIEALSSTADVPRIVLLLDVSGSMRMKWKYELAFARAFVRSMQDNDEIGFMAFNDRVVSRVPVSADRRPLSAELQRLEETKDLPWGPSSIADSLNAAVGFLPAGRNRAIYLITDAGDNTSQESFKQLGEVAVKSNTRLFALVMGDTEIGNSKSSMGKLHELAQATGGEAFRLDVPDDILMQKAARAIKAGIEEPVEIKFHADGASVTPKLKIRFASPQLAKEFSILAPETATSACDAVSPTTSH